MPHLSGYGTESNMCDCDFALDAGHFGHLGSEVAMLGAEQINQFHSDNESVQLKIWCRWSKIYFYLIQEILNSEKANEQDEGSGMKSKVLKILSVMIGDPTPADDEVIVSVRAWSSRYFWWRIAGLSSAYALYFRWRISGVLKKLSQCFRLVRGDRHNELANRWRHGGRRTYRRPCGEGLYSRKEPGSFAR